MRAVVQRVTSAEVTVDKAVVGAIGQGLCALVGVTHADGVENAMRLAEKLWQLRVFEDEEGKMNRAAADLDLPILIVSQFTLYADSTRGRRPSFIDAAPPERAEPLIDTLVARLLDLGARVETGRFRARMAVRLTNDGPVTLLLET